MKLQIEIDASSAEIDAWRHSLKMDAGGQFEVNGVDLLPLINQLLVHLSVCDFTPKEQNASESK